MLPEQPKLVRAPDRVLKALLRCLSVYPDQRVAQIIVNATAPNPFYWEDEQVALALDRYADEAWNDLTKVDD